MTKTALVTGGARGIGRACALALADSGFDIALVDLLEKEMAATARDIEARGKRTLTFQADVSDFAPHFGTLVGARAKRPAPYGAQQLVLRQREESPRSQTSRHPGRAPRQQHRTPLPSDPLDGAPPALDALLAHA